MGTRAEYESGFERKLSSSRNLDSITTPKKSEKFDNFRSSTTKENEKSRAKSPGLNDATFSRSKSPRFTDDNNNVLDMKKEQRVPLSPRNSYEDEKDIRQSRKPKVMDTDDDYLVGFNRSRNDKNTENDNLRHTTSEFDPLGRNSEREFRTRKISDKDNPFSRSKTPDNKSPTDSRSHSPKTPTERDNKTSKNTTSILKRPTSGGEKISTTTPRNDDILKPTDGRKSPRRKSIERKKQLYEFGTSIDDDDDDDDEIGAKEGELDRSNPLRRSRSFKDGDNSHDMLTNTRTIKKSDGLVMRDRHDDIDFDVRRTNSSKTSKSPVYDELNSKLSEKKSNRKSFEEDSGGIEDRKNRDGEDRRKFSRGGSSGVTKRFDYAEDDEVIEDTREKHDKSDRPSSMRREKSFEGRKQLEQEDTSIKKNRERPFSAKREKSFERGKNEKEELSRSSSAKREKSLERRQKGDEEELKDNEIPSIMKREKSFERGRKEKDELISKERPSSMKRENRHKEEESKERDNKPSSMKKEKSFDRESKKEKSFLDDDLFGDNSSTPKIDHKNKEVKGEKSLEREERTKQRVSKEAGRGEELSFSELMAQRKKEREAEKNKSKETSVRSKSPNQRPKSAQRQKDHDVNSDEEDRLRTPKGSPKRRPLQRQIKVPDSSPETEKDEAKKEGEKMALNVRRKSTAEQPSVKEKERGRRERSSSVTDLKKNRKDKDEVDALSERLNATTSFEDLASDKSRKEKSNLSKQRSLSATNVRHPSSSPKRDKLSKSSSTNKLSGNRKLSGTKVDTTYTVPTNSNDLKEMIYHQWLERKKVQTKEEIKAKMLAQKKAAKQAEEEANERKVTAQKIYDAWNNSKTDKMQNEKGMKIKQKQAEKEKMEEALQKKKDAEKYFESWKREKDEKIKKMISQKKKEEKKKDKEKFDIKRQTTEEALKAFESWKAQKARDLAEQKKKEEEEKAKAGEEKLMAFEKKQEALRVYEQWKNVKKSPRAESPQLVQRGRDKDVSMVIDVKITKRNQNGIQDVKSANRTGATSPRPVRSSHKLEMATSPVTPRVPRFCRPATVVAKLASLVTKTANQKANSPTTVNTTYSVSPKPNSRYSKSPIKPNPLANRVFRKPTSPADKNPIQSISPKPVYRSESIYSKTNRIATVATLASRVRKPTSILKTSRRNPSPADEDEGTPKEESRRRWFPHKWTVYHFLLWKILACLAILYYAEQFMEHLIFKGADPCFKMAAKCLTDFASSASRCLYGFAESFMALKNDTVNNRPGIMTCIPNAMHEFRNCIKPNR